MRAGALTRRIVIQQHVSGQDEIGQPIDVWTDVATVWADIRHTSGLEAVRGGAEVSTVKVSVRIRYRTDVHAGMRVIHETYVYNILAVLPDVAGREFVDLVCEVLT